MGLANPSGGTYNPGYQPPKKLPSGQYAPGNAETLMNLGGPSMKGGAFGPGNYDTTAPAYTTHGYFQQNPIAPQPAPKQPTVIGAPQAQTPAAAPAEGPLSGPGYYEKFYEEHGGDLMGPSSSEQLFAKGMEGSNPFYDYAEQRATDSVNAAARARGGWNSGAAVQQIGNQSSYLRGQQAKGLTDLAGQSDTSKLGRYGLTGQMADRAQSHKEDRLTGGYDREYGIGKAQADDVQGFYGAAGQLSQTPGMAAIEAKLKAAGMDAAEIKQFFDMVTGTAKVAISAV